MKTFLFQGDSITDKGRSRENDAWLGHGYVTMTSGMIASSHPGEFTFFNRGVSGNRSVDMYARIKADVINLKPDYMSVLIGVNDVWHEISYTNGVSADKYKRIFSDFIREIKEALPGIRIIILEPFVLDGIKTHENLDLFRKEVSLRAEKAKEVAEENGLLFVPLQKKLEALEEKIAPLHVLLDGVHPAVHGDALIANELKNAFEKLYSI